MMNVGDVQCSGEDHEYSGGIPRRMWRDIFSEKNKGKQLFNLVPFRIYTMISSAVPRITSTVLNIPHSLHTLNTVISKTTKKTSSK